jgi:uncharacterized repeat protein (TIGR03803 family)
MRASASRILLGCGTICLVASCFGEFSEQTLKSFENYGYPIAPLVQGSDGAFYGTTWGYREGDSGTVFRLNHDGTGFATLHDFNASVDDLLFPGAGLIRASDGALFGTTQSGRGGVGGVFKISPDRSSYQILHNFCACQDDGQSPFAGLLQGTNGVLYGTTFSGGISNLGTVFKINPDGTGYTNLYSFGADAATGANPQGNLVNLVQGSNDVLFGTTYSGGASNVGTVFKINPDGTGYTTLYSFGMNSADGANPSAGLIFGTNDMLFGTTYGGGASNVGTVFRINPDGTGYATLYSFGMNSNDGANPRAGLLQAKDGALYGTTFGGGPTFGGGSIYSSGISNLGTVFRVNPDGSGYEVVYSFTGSGGDGANPQAGLVQSADGDLYGTTLYGGKGAGTVFRLTGKPVIRVQPKNQTVLAGANITFSVSVSSALPPWYQWHFNGVTLLDETNATLTLTNVQVADSGRYWVGVTNSYGGTTSAIANLLVVLEPPVPVTDCTEDALRYSMSFGGKIPVLCDGTINVAETITNAVDAVLDATGHEVTIGGGNLVRLFYVPTNVHFKLVNVTLAYGLARNGAGVLNDGGRLTLQDVRFQSNNASAGGGAVFNRAGTVEATNCTFSDNIIFHDELDLSGGGSLANEGGRVTMRNCAFISNSAYGTPALFAKSFASPGSGGAIYNSGEMSAILCNFVGNLATGGAGGDNNLLNSPGYDGGIGNGGAICNVGTLTVESTTFSNNVANGGTGGIGMNAFGSLDPIRGGQGRSGGAAGGGAIFDGGVSSILSSSFTGNYAVGGMGGPGGRGNTGPGGSTIGPAGNGGTGGDAFGGALYTTNRNSALTNCTFANNSVTGGNGGWGGVGGGGSFGAGGGSLGGAFFSTNSQIYLDSCTIALNRANSGGGLFSGGATLVNTLLANNSPDNNFGILIDLGHNLSSDSSCSFTGPSSKNNVDPLLGSLADNGGAALTMALLLGSPAIDAGNPSVLQSADQRGYPRTCGPAPDIGACEFCYWSTIQTKPPPASDYDILFIGPPGQTARLLTGTAFTDWTPVATNQIGGNGILIFRIDLGVEERRFFRIAVP